MQPATGSATVVKRPPFKLGGNVHITARWLWYDSTGTQRQAVKSARAPFAWMHYVLMPLACGSTDRVEVTRSSKRPFVWHTIDYTADEAARLLIDHAGMQRGSTTRQVNRHRAKRGLEPVT